MKRVVLLVAVLTSVCCFAGITINTPANNQTVAAPTHLVLSVTPKNSNSKISTINVYADSVLVYGLQHQSQVNAYLFLTVGTHAITVKATDSAGVQYSQSLKIYVNALRPLSKIDDMGGWRWCTRLLNGKVCAAGAGNALSSQSRFQTSPSLDGSSTEFWLGGSTGYSNALWWKSLGGGSRVSHFKYDFWVYVDNPSVSQSLEFDLNQSFGGHRWVFGTQCDFKDTKHWDVWDSGSNQWKATSIPCKPFPQKQWVHIVWNFERVGTKVHYISLVSNGTTIPVNLYWNYQASYPFSDINVAFQMDGDYQQDDYHVWIDKMTVTAW